MYSMFLLAIQKKKAEMIGGALGLNDEEAKASRLEDLRSIFAQQEL